MTVEQAHALMTEMAGRHRRRMPANVESPFELRSASLGSVAIGIFWSSVPVQMATPVNELGLYVLQFPLTSRIRVEYGDEAFSAKQGEGVIYSPFRSFNVERSPGWTMAVNVPQALVRTRAERLGIEVGEPVIFDSLVTDTAAEVQGFVLLMAAAVDVGTIRSGSTAADVLEDAFVDLLLRRLRHNYSNRVGVSEEEVLARRVSAVEEYAKRNVARRMTLKQLAEAAGCSERTLQATFAKRFGASPLTFVQSRRMAMARAFLQAPGSSTTVESVARSVGYSNPGRFAVDYRRVYDERPRETIERVRKSPSTG